MHGDSDTSCPPTQGKLLHDALKKAGAAEAETPLTLTYLDQGLDAGKIRLGVEVQNPETPEYPHGRLIPGRRVTVVVEP